jgi:hypothetical protein
MIKMIASDGESVAIAAEDKQVQIRARKRDTAGKGQGATVNIVRAVGLDEIGKSAGTTDPCDRGDLLVPQFSFFNDFLVRPLRSESGRGATVIFPPRAGISEI